MSERPNIIDLRARRWEREEEKRRPLRVNGADVVRALIEESRPLGPDFERVWDRNTATLWEE